jgi:hypothetical protein
VLEYLTSYFEADRRVTRHPPFGLPDTQVTRHPPFGDHVARHRLWSPDTHRLPLARPFAVVARHPTFV